MSQLRFRTIFGSQELNQLPLPVEVRRGNLALVAQALSTDRVTVEPGTYHVTARLPAGQELYQEVSVAEGQEAEVALAPEPEDQSPHEWHEPQHYLLQALRATREDLDLDRGVGVMPPSVGIRAFAGNLLTDACVAIPQADWFQPQPKGMPGVVLLRVTVTDLKVAQVLQPDAPPLNVALPMSRAPSPDRGCSLVIARQPEGRFSVDVQLDDLAADALLHYYERGQMTEVATAASTPTLTEDRRALQAAQLVADKVQDPIGAALGAYTLLRMGEVEHLHDWTGNLKDWFPWLPDGVVIRAEHLALVGQHEQAFNTLLELPARGLPIFGDGLSYAVDRLRLYVAAKSLGATTTDAPETIALLDKLQRVAMFADLRKPVLNFSGLDPTRPSRELLDEAQRPPAAAIGHLLT